LYERVRSSSKKEVVLAEMQRLGFWPADKDSPTAEAELVRREGELSRALQELGTQLQNVRDPVAALKAMRKERMKRAREKREETKQKRAQQRLAKAAAWHERRQRELLYLGAGVSAGLNQVESDIAKLRAANLPILHATQELADAMGVQLAELRFLAFDRRVSRISHYRRFAMAKKTGGERIISAPMPRLKRAQYWVLDNVLARVPLHAAAHGFVAGRSIVSNALPHVGRNVVVNLDLKDFFPSVAMPRVKGVFRQLGYSEQVATTLALLCTERKTDEVVVDGEKFFVGHKERVLPQGAPTSPALTNILCRRLDARLQGAAQKLGFRYTRYADDLTFSADATAAKLVGKMLWRAKQIVIAEGFTPHPEKEQVMRKRGQQHVTGIVVNSKPSLDRDTIKRFRATLFQVEKDGPQGKQWNGNSNIISALEGYAHFIVMVDKERGLPYLQRVHALKTKWSQAGSDAPLADGKHHSDFRKLAADGKAPWDGWWQPSQPTAPMLEKTALQIAEEKQAKKVEQKQAQQVPQVQATQATPSRPAVQFGQNPPVQTTRSGEKPPVPPVRNIPFADLMIQIGISLYVAIHYRSALAFAVGMCLFGWGLMSRKVNWLIYIVAMILIVVGTR
jgi:retron-type reverse transcriptase